MYEPEVMDEHTEGVFRGTMIRLQHAVGEDEYRKAMIQIAIAREAYLRANAAPDHPMLVLLDEHRAEQASEAWRT